MAVKTRASNSQSDSTVKCGTCGEDVQPGTVHCEGSNLAFGCLIRAPHHGQHIWAPCWKCGGYLGCSLCVPGDFDKQLGMWLNIDLACMRCRVKCTKESLLNGGPISKHFMATGNNIVEWGTIQRHTPTLREYRPEWVAAYYERCRDLGIDPEQDDTAAWKEARRAFEEFKIGKFSKPKGHYALLREKNRQAKELQETA